MAKRSPLPAADQRPIHSHYREDLAHIHDAGYGAIAEDAAARRRRACSRATSRRSGRSARCTAATGKSTAWCCWIPPPCGARSRAPGVPLPPGVVAFAARKTESAPPWSGHHCESRALAL